MLIKLTVVNSNHFIRYKCKTTSRLSNITRLSKIIWIYITIDDNEKLSINELLEVLIGVGTFSSTSSFDTQCLLFVTINELKVYAMRFAIFSFSLVSFIQCLLFIGIWSYLTQRDVCRKSRSIFPSRRTQFTYRLNE